MEQQYRHLAVTAVIAFGGLTTVLLAAKFGHSDLVLLIFFAGSLGSVINNYFRIAKIAANPQAVETDLKNRFVIAQMYISLLISGILAFIAYGLFISGLLGGELFPKFVRVAEPYGDVTELLAQVRPEQNHDTVKAVLWGFIAGFFERFVPNIIDRVVAKSEQG